MLNFANNEIKIKATIRYPFQLSFGKHFKELIRIFKNPTLSKLLVRMFRIQGI